MHRKKPRQASSDANPPTVFEGGRYQPLTDKDCAQIINSAFEILNTVGLTGTPDWLVKLFVSQGARLSENGRMVFPSLMIEKALNQSASKVSLPGFDDHHGLDVGQGLVHIGTGGAAVHTLDGETGDYHESSLADLYHMMRILDHCDHVHYGVRPLIARDIKSPLDLDVNTAYTCLKATQKPIGVSFHHASHVNTVIDLFNLALEDEQGFRRHPFCMAIIVHVVPPLSFATEGVQIMRSAINAGMPLQICSAGQAGATSPVTLAGALAQGLAESLAGMLVVNALKPGHPCIYAFMPFISDLRTGAMTGGSGESALANAAAAQLLRRLDLPSTVSAGMTDSKTCDIQAGYEKGYSITLAAQAGADMINLSVGMLSSITVASAESLIIDNDMCGAILRTVRGIEVNADMLDISQIEQVVCGDGHYLGEPQTLALMKTEYLYPQLADRQSLANWLDSGRQSIWENANKRVREILDDTVPTHLSNKADRMIREKFNIQLKY